MNKKIVRITTVPISLKILLKGQLKFMSNYFEIIGVSSQGPELFDVAAQEGVRVIPLNMTRTVSPILDLISLVKMFFLFLKERPDIVHTHTPKAGIIGMLAAKMAKVPIRLHTVAGLPLMEHTGLKRFIFNIVEKLTYINATRIYPNSKGLYDYIIENKFTSKEKLKLISQGSSNGINTNYFDPNIISNEIKLNTLKEIGLNPMDFNFIFIGRLVKDKGINELVKAFSDLNLLNVNLVLVGNFEPNLDPLDPRTIYTINNNPKIFSLGFKEDVRPYLACCHCLVFPSYREGFPNVVMQAGAMGLPSIVCNINGCNEIIIDGINGIVIQPKNINALKEAIYKIYSEKLFYTKSSKCARDLIINRYKQEIIWKELLIEYNNYLKN